MGGNYIGIFLKALRTHSKCGLYLMLPLRRNGFNQFQRLSDVMASAFYLYLASTSYPDCGSFVSLLIKVTFISFPQDRQHADSVKQTRFLPYGVVCIVAIGQFLESKEKPSGLSILLKLLPKFHYIDKTRVTCENSRIFLMNVLIMRWFVLSTFL